MTKVGEHVTLDIIGTTKEYDPSLFESVIHKIAKAADVTVLEVSKYKFEPQGFTLVALLSESHFSFHTFPEKGVISFDFFTCGKVHPKVALKILKKLNGSLHYLITSVCISRNGAMIWNFTEQSELQMKKLSDHQLNDYLKKIKTETLLAYGVYQIEAGGLELFESVKGDRDAIMGLPIKQIIDYIKTST